MRCGQRWRGRASRAEQRSAESRRRGGSGGGRGRRTDKAAWEVRKSDLLLSTSECRGADEILDSDRLVLFIFPGTRP